MKQIYVIRKYIVANSAKDAIKKEKGIPPHDVWLEETTQKNILEQLFKEDNHIGFKK